MKQGKSAGARQNLRQPVAAAEETTGDVLRVPQGCSPA